MVGSNRTGKALTVARRAARAEDLTLPAILEFQWPSTAIANAPIPRSARGVVWIVTSMVASFIAVMAMIPVDQVVTARGIVVSQAPTTLVQPLETAIVRSIDVREGEQVRAGQVLARLDSTFATADLSALVSQVSTLEAEAARLVAESAGKPFDYIGSAPAMLMQLAIYEHRKAEFSDKIDNYNHRHDQLSSVIARANSDAAGYRDRLRVATELEGMRKQLQDLAVGSKVNTLAAMDNRAEMQRALANAEQTATSAKLEQAALESERNSYMQGWRADVAQKLADASVKLNDAREQVNKAKLRHQMVELHAERDAIVQSIARVSVGSVLQSGQQFLTLVPMDVPLEIEANISGRDNGFVHVDNPAVIKFDTFPYSQYGSADGTVRMVSPDAFTPQDEARNPTSAVPLTASNLEPFYRARISIDRAKLHGVPAGFHITPGMPVTADVRVGERTVLKYLLGWVMPLAQEGMREP